MLAVVDLFPSFGKAVRVDIRPTDLGLPPDTDLTMRDELDGVHCYAERVPLGNHSPARVLTCTRA